VYSISRRKCAVLAKRSKSDFYHQPQFDAMIIDSGSSVLLPIKREKKTISMKTLSFG
jgi:hypothetical protein